MPRENRKRGRGKKAQKEAPEHDGDASATEAQLPTPPAVDVMDVAVESTEPVASSSADIAGAPPPACAPFPELDPDSKAYWRGIDDKIRELESLGVGKGKQRRHQDGEGEAEEDDDEDERQLLLRSALVELSGHELALAADPETSIILERLLYSMDDFAKRVLMDRFAGGFSVLSSHRHASHPLQTLLASSASTLEREAKGKAVKQPTSNRGDEVGELLPMSDLLVNACEELLPNLQDLSHSPCASHILALLLVLTSGKPLPEDSFRSKKSSKWRTRQAGGPIRGMSIVPEDHADHIDATASKGKGSAIETPKVKKEVRKAGEKLYHALRDLWREKYGVAARQAACDSVTSQLVQIVLRLEAERAESEVSGSLTDAVLDGLVTTMLGATEGKQVQTPRSDYVETCLRDATPSHALEVIISNASPRLSAVVFEVYFSQRLSKLCSHPVANFVVAKVVLQLPAEKIVEATAEIGPRMADLVESGRTGPMQALVTRAIALHAGEAEVLKAILVAFDVEDKDAGKRRYALPCIVALMRLEHFKKTTAYASLANPASEGVEPPKLPESAMQGSLLLQSLLRLSSPTVDSLLDDSFHTLPFSFVLGYSRDPIASRVFDVLLSSPALPARHRRKFLLKLIGHYDVLADDRVGSHVADRCWEAADGYLKEKIAESLVGPKEQRALQASPWGHHFARKLHLPLFERRRDDWKAKVAAESPAPVPVASPKSNGPTTNAPVPSTVRGVKRPADELDAIFDPVVKSKSKPSRTSHPTPFRPGQGQGHKAAKGRKAGPAADGQGGDAVAAAAAQVLGDKAMKDLMRMVKKS